MINARKRLGLACAVLGLMVMAAGRSQADIIYDNLPTDTYKSSGVDIITGTNFGLTTHTETFVATASGTEADIKVPMVFIQGSGATSDFTLTLKDSSGNVLDVLQGTALIDIGQTTPVAEVFSTLHPFLTAGKTYALTASPSSTTTFVGWDLGDSNQPDRTAGFRVESAPAAIPEPGTFVEVAAASLFGLACAWRRRKRPAA